jgi:CDP-archaeol synthase
VSLSALWIFLPLIGSFLVHAVVLRFDLLPWLKRPLDGGMRLRGRRLLGDNKTWRGALAMGGGIFALALALWELPTYRSRLPEDVRTAPAPLFAAALAIGAVGAELPNSFLKRQLDIAPGDQRRTPLGLALTVLDQGDFVFGIWLALLPIWRMSAAEGALAFLVVTVIHVAVSAAGYGLGLRRTIL